MVEEENGGHLTVVPPGPRAGPHTRCIGLLPPGAPSRGAAGRLRPGGTTKGPKHSSLAVIAIVIDIGDWRRERPECRLVNMPIPKLMSPQTKYHTTPELANTFLFFLLGGV